MIKTLIKIILALLVIVTVIIGLSYFIPMNYQLNQLTLKQMQSPSGHYLYTDNIQIYYEEYGQVTDNAIILIHGFGGSTYSWNNNISTLVNDGYHVIALDLPGFGLSTKNLTQDLTQEHQAYYIKLLADSLSIKQAIVIGHSLGGAIALRLFHDYPGFVSKLVLVDAAVTNSNNIVVPANLISADPLLRVSRQLLHLFYTPDRLKELYLSAYNNKDRPSAEQITEYQSRNFYGDWDLSLLDLLSTTPDQALNIPQLQLNIPVLIIWGQNDPWIDKTAGEQLHKDIPDSQLITISDSGHLPMEEQPEQFNMSLLTFLNHN